MSVVKWLIIYYYYLIFIYTIYKNDINNLQFPCKALWQRFHLVLCCNLSSAKSTFFKQAFMHMVVCSWYYDSVPKMRLLHRLAYSVAMYEIITPVWWYVSYHHILTNTQPSYIHIWIEWRQKVRRQKVVFLTALPHTLRPSMGWLTSLFCNSFHRPH